MANVNETKERIAQIQKENESLRNKLAKTPNPGATLVNSDVTTNVPNIRTGENIMSSRGFSFAKMLGVLTGAIDPSEAKVEGDVSARLHNAYVKNMGGTGYEYHGKNPNNRYMAPLGSDFMHEGHVSPQFRMEVKQLVEAGVSGLDPHAADAWCKKHLPQWRYKTLSWLQETAGGSLVSPPDQGELIELLRNKEALVNAGARTIPLPPQGRLKYPRQTGASTAYWVGENAPITTSDITTGEITLQAKKLAAIIRMPNELLRFATPAVEALVRDDLTKTLALALDLACLEGTGGDNKPLGILNYAGINRVTSSRAGANGDGIEPQDIYRMISAVQENLVEMEGWLMRPKLLNRFYQQRADAVVTNDARGPFVFDLIREANDSMKESLAGYPVTISTQVSQNRTKGGSSNLTYILGGAFSNVLIGMFGAMEFASFNQSDSTIINDQTLVRAILTADMALRYESAFVLMDNLIA